MAAFVRPFCKGYQNRSPHAAHLHLHAPPSSGGSTSVNIRPTAALQEPLLFGLYLMRLFPSSR